jgi:Plant transposon protein
MRRALFLRIAEGVKNHDSYFQNKVDSTRRKSLSTMQKCTAAMRMLAYGVAPDVVDEYLRIGESTTRKCTERFVRAFINIFGEEHMRRPNVADIERLLHMGQQRRFPGMLGSIDCMHWEWKNYPIAWHGQYVRGDHKCLTIMFETVASQDLWIWLAFFGLPGSLNGINVLDRFREDENDEWTSFYNVIN